MGEAGPLYFFGTTAGGVDTVREAWPVAAVMPRPVAITGVAVFQLPPVLVVRAEVLPGGQVLLAGR
jgi:hypothetical protein